MALDQIILEEVAARRSPPTLRFLQFKPAAALVGYNQDVAAEIRIDYCSRNGIDVNRRLTGGGGILFQESALGWELFAPQGDEPFRGRFEDVLNRICEAAAGAISRLGLVACFRPRNDIEVAGRKISGTGGVAISGGFMFQGTLLVENEIELFLKALRVPVEKLKKREIESLMDRICFLYDLVPSRPPISAIKRAFVEEFEALLDMRLYPAPLTPAEQERLNNESGYFASADWINLKRKSNGSEPIRTITQTRAGTLRTHLWLDPHGNYIALALICGDFFAVPSRLIHDLEAALVGCRMDRAKLFERVMNFFRDYDGKLLGIAPETVADSIASGVDKLLLAKRGFTRAEANELFLINLSAKEVTDLSPKSLLLPYCSKNLDCDFRFVEGCDECGGCEIAECFELARGHGMEPITIQSFEHLNEILTKLGGMGETYIGSCCEAFFAKHQAEMIRTRARGVLINLDSTTCYDLGKGSHAYQGNFDNKTELNLGLIRKTLEKLHGYGN